MSAVCTHTDTIKVTDLPDEIAGCADCLAMGGTWVHLRMCSTCGKIGCCDNSPNRHATAHFTETGHPLIRSAEPGELTVRSELSRSEPKRAPIFVRHAGRHNRRHRGFNLAFAIQRRFEKEAVELHSERREIAVLLIAQIRDGEAFDGGKIIDIATGGHVDAVAFDRCPRQVVARDLGDVFGAVATLGKHNDLTLQFFRARLHR